MQVIGLSAAEQNSIFKTLATILWLGNVDFRENEDGNAMIADTGVTDFVAYLMECDPAQVQKSLLNRVVETQRGGRRGQPPDKSSSKLTLRVCVRGAAKCRPSVVGSRCACKGPLQQPVRMDRQPRQRLDEAAICDRLCYRRTRHLVRLASSCQSC